MDFLCILPVIVLVGLIVWIIVKSNSSKDDKPAKEALIKQLKNGEELQHHTVGGTKGASNDALSQGLLGGSLSQIGSENVFVGFTNERVFGVVASNPESPVFEFPRTDLLEISFEPGAYNSILNMKTSNNEYNFYFRSKFWSKKTRELVEEINNSKKN